MAEEECPRRMSKNDGGAKLEIQESIINEERTTEEQAALRAIKEAIRINRIQISREESTRSSATLVLDSERESLFLFNTFADDLIQRANCT